jgi:hypothetical protein
MADSDDELLAERLLELSELVRECQAGLRVVTRSDVEAAIIALGSMFERD